MKSLKVLFCATALVFSFSASAEGLEELCADVAESDVRMKILMTKDKKFFESSLTELMSSDSPHKVELREKLFFINNRLHLNDAAFKQLSFIRCITGTW